MSRSGPRPPRRPSPARPGRAAAVRRRPRRRARPARSRAARRRSTGPPWSGQPSGPGAGGRAQVAGRSDSPRRSMRRAPDRSQAAHRASGSPARGIGRASSPPGRSSVTKPKGAGPHDPPMKTNERARVEARSRAGRRLRNLTIGTAILGVAATGALGWVAAGTPVGASTPSPSTAIVTNGTTNARNGRVDRERPGGDGDGRSRPCDHGRQLTPVADGLVAREGGAAGEASLLTGGPDDPIAQADWRALGTGVRLLVIGGDLAAARAAVERVLADVDLAYSRFRPDSELVALNAAAGRTVRLGPLLARALQGSIDAARRTGGAVDPTVGRALRVVGYDADFGLLAGTTRPLELHVAPVPGWTAMAFDPHARTLRVPAGVELDLGLDRQGARSRPGRRGRPRGDRRRCRRPGQPRRRHRHGRASPGRGLADPPRRGQQRPVRRRGRGDRDPAAERWPPRAPPSAGGRAATA